MDTSEEKESESNLSDEKASLEVPVVNNSSLEFAEPKIKKTGQILRNTYLQNTSFIKYSHSQKLC